MNMINITDWTHWGTCALNDYLDRVQDVLTPPAPPAPAAALPGEDVYVPPPPRARDRARLNTLREQKRRLDGERASYQRSYYTSGFMLGVSGIACVVGIAMFNNPFTIPLGFMLALGGFVGAFTFYPRCNEYNDATRRLTTEVDVLRGQIMEAER